MNNSCGIQLEKCTAWPQVKYVFVPANFIKINKQFY